MALVLAVDLFYNENYAKKTCFYPRISQKFQDTRFLIPPTFLKRRDIPNPLRPLESTHTTYPRKIYRCALKKYFPTEKKLLMFFGPKIREIS